MTRAVKLYVIYKIHCEKLIKIKVLYSKSIVVTVTNVHVSPNLKIEKDPHVSWFPEITFPYFCCQEPELSPQVSSSPTVAGHRG